jgi:hypothetical protein
MRRRLEMGRIGPANRRDGGAAASSWLLLTILLGFASVFDLFWRLGNRLRIYFTHKDCMSDFPGINFANPSRVTTDPHRPAHFLLRCHELDE